MLFTTLYNYFVQMLVQMLVQILTRFLPAQHLTKINLIEPYSSVLVSNIVVLL
jgi:hypothetical protein